jgi:hypothetical protein
MSGAFGGVNVSTLGEQADSAYDSRKDEMAMEANHLALADARRNDEQKQALHNQQMFINDNYDAIANDVKEIDPEADDYDDRIASLPLGVRESPLLKSKMESLVREREGVQRGRVASHTAYNTKRKSDMSTFGSTYGQHLTDSEMAEANLLYQQNPDWGLPQLAMKYGRRSGIREVNTNHSKLLEERTKFDSNKHKVAASTHGVTYSRIESKKRSITSLIAKEAAMTAKFNDKSDNADGSKKVKPSQSEIAAVKAAITRAEGELIVLDGYLVNQTKDLEIASGHLNDSTELAKEGLYDRSKDQLIGGAIELSDEWKATEGIEDAGQQEAIRRGIVSDSMETYHSLDTMVPESRKQADTSFGNSKPSTQLSRAAVRHFTKTNEAVYMDEAGNYNFNPFIKLSKEERHQALKGAEFDNLMGDDASRLRFREMLQSQGVESSDQHIEIYKQIIKGVPLGAIEGIEALPKEQVYSISKNVEAGLYANIGRDKTESNKVAYDDAVEGVKLLIKASDKELIPDDTKEDALTRMNQDLVFSLENGDKDFFVTRYSPLSEKPTDDEKARRRAFTDLFNSAYALESHNEPDTLEGELEKLAISFRKP